jgi:hypothetical protein
MRAQIRNCWAFQGDGKIPFNCAGIARVIVSSKTPLNKPTVSIEHTSTDAPVLD